MCIKSKDRFFSQGLIIIYIILMNDEVNASTYTCGFQLYDAHDKLLFSPMINFFNIYKSRPTIFP
jgi:hypothetical protein